MGFGSPRINEHILAMMREEGIRYENEQRRKRMSHRERLMEALRGLTPVEKRGLLLWALDQVTQEDAREVARSKEAYAVADVPIPVDPDLLIQESISSDRPAAEPFSGGDGGSSGGAGASASWDSPTDSSSSSDGGSSSSGGSD